MKVIQIAMSAMSIYYDTLADNTKTIARHKAIDWLNDLAKDNKLNYCNAIEIINYINSK